VADKVINEKEMKMATVLCRTNKYYFVILVITVLFLLSSCNTGFLTKSAQELTGGNGAGLSEYQATPMP